MTIRSTVMSKSWLGALLLTLTCLASNSKSEIGQHKTHSQYRALKSQHRFDLHPKKYLDKDEYPLNNDIVPDLYVRRGDVLLGETTTMKPLLFRQKREVKRNRNSESQFAYIIRTSSFSLSAIFIPQTYDVQRPYYIPILETEDDVPYYFPPQSLSSSTEFPLDILSVLCDTSITENISPANIPTTSTETILSDRFFNPISDTQSEPVTTARPLMTSTFPPLIHKPDPYISMDLSNQDVVFRTTPRTTTTRRKPIPPPTTSPPKRTTPRTTTTRKPMRPPTKSSPKRTSGEGPRVSESGQTRCDLAIKNCCLAGSEAVDLNCFEQFECPGPFWDTNPCQN